MKHSVFFRDASTETLRNARFSRGGPLKYPSENEKLVAKNAPRFCRTPWSETISTAEQQNVQKPRSHTHNPQLRAQHEKRLEECISKTTLPHADPRNCPPYRCILLAPPPKSRSPGIEVRRLTRFPPFRDCTMDSEGHV